MSGNSRDALLMVAPGEAGVSPANWHQRSELHNKRRGMVTYATVNKV